MEITFQAFQELIAGETNDTNGFEVPLLGHILFCWRFQTCFVFRFVSWLLVIDSRKFLGGIISIFVALTSPFLLVESSFLCWHLLFWQVKFGETLIFTDSRHMIKSWNNIYIHTYILLTDQITKPCLKHVLRIMILLGSTEHRNPFWNHPRRRRLGRRRTGPKWDRHGTVLLQLGYHQ